MRITVKAQGHLKQFRADGRETFTMTVPAGATVRALIEASGVPWDEVGLIAVNGAMAPEERLLSDGDEVMLLAPMEGGEF